MNLRISFIALAAATVGFAAMTGCGDDGTIGSSLLEDQVEIIIDSSFTVTGGPVAMSNVQPRTLSMLIGNIHIPEFGSISSTVASQFLPSTAIDTTYDLDDLDSVFLNLRYAAGAFIGDSVVPMGIAAYPLNDVLSGDLYTNSPLPSHESTALASAVFAPSTLGNDSLAELETRTVAIKLPLSFGKELLTAYYDNPDNYTGGDRFVNNVFKGLYFDSDYGTGRLMQFARCTITMNMSTTTIEDEDTTTTSDELEYYAVSPELVNNNYIDVDIAPALQQRVDAGEPIVIAPVGYNVKVRFPAPEVIEAYNNHGGIMAVLNSVTFSVPADTISSNGLVPAPTYLLMVLEKDLPTYFSESKTPDNETSFYATYDETNKCYDFSGLGTYISNLMDSGEELTEEDYTFCLVPVSIDFEVDMYSYSYYSYSYMVSEVLPYIEGPAVAVLDLDNAKVKLTYSRQVAY